MVIPCSCEVHPEKPPPCFRVRKAFCCKIFYSSPKSASNFAKRSKISSTSMYLFPYSQIALAAASRSLGRFSALLIMFAIVSTATLICPLRYLTPHAIYRLWRRCSGPQKRFFKVVIYITRSDTRAACAASRIVRWASKSCRILSSLRQLMV